MLLLRPHVFSGFVRHAIRTAAYSSASNKVLFVRTANANEHLLSLELRFEMNEAVRLNRSFFFTSNKQGNCLFLREKIIAKIGKRLQEKTKRLNAAGKAVSCPSLEASFFTASGEPIPLEASIGDALKSDNFVRICQEDYKIIKDPPSVLHFGMPKVLMRGIPIHLELQVENCSFADCLIQWFVLKSNFRPSPNDERWELVHTGVEFTVASPDAVGQWVKVRIQPKSSDGSILGSEVVEVSQSPIADLNVTLEESPIRQRHNLTQTVLSEPCVFRTVSYNLLSDFYADSDYSRNHLFPYCKPCFLDKNYRQSFILWELKNYNADLLCLQEVDRSFFKRILYPVMCGQGEFEAVFLNKLNSHPEGLAIFFRRKKFFLIEQSPLQSVSEALFTLGVPAFESLRESVKANEKFYTKWMSRNQCLLTLLLGFVDDPSRQLIVSTVHLHSSPLDSHIRLLQTGVCLKHIEMVREKAKPRCGVVFTGDFNSQPGRGVQRLATDGHVDVNNPDWYSQGNEEYIGSPTLDHKLTLASAYSLDGEICTNFTAMFSGCLDYIFYDSSQLTSTLSVPLPNYRELTKGIALPNSYFPSDHVALISELTCNDT